MTLKEKFKNIVCNVEISNEKLINKSEQIADDYAIDFAKWGGMPVVDIDVEELLEIFKKEKGL
jgi:hypothetical protein